MKFRRVVTGHNEKGKSCVKWDTEINPLPLRPGASNIPLWATRTLPAQFTEEDPNTWELGTSLAGGSGEVSRFDAGGLFPLKPGLPGKGVREAAGSQSKYRDPPWNPRLNPSLPPFTKGRNSPL